MSSLAKAWAEMINEQNPDRQREIKERLKRKREEAKRKEKEKRLNKWVKLPEGLTGRNLSVVLRSLESQITSDLLDLEVESFTISDGKIFVRFKEEEAE